MEEVLRLLDEVRGKVKREKCSEVNLLMMELIECLCSEVMELRKEVDESLDPDLTDALERCIDQLQEAASREQT